MPSKRAAALVWLGFMVWACANGRANTRKDDVMVSQQATPQRIPALKSLVRPSGRHPLPKAFDDGERVWLDAMKEYEADRYEPAARKFIDAANLFYTEPDNTYFQDVLSARTAAYHNAWQCFMAAGADERGRKELLKASAEDPECGDDIERLLKE